jgi:hypothetical protein
LWPSESAFGGETVDLTRAQPEPFRQDLRGMLAKKRRTPRGRRRRVIEAHRARNVPHVA